MEFVSLAVALGVLVYVVVRDRRKDKERASRPVDRTAPAPDRIRTRDVNGRDRRTGDYDLR